jgi:hypothetical protein
MVHCVCPMHVYVNFMAVSGPTMVHSVGKKVILAESPNTAARCDSIAGGSLRRLGLFTRPQPPQLGLLGVLDLDASSLDHSHHSHHSWDYSQIRLTTITHYLPSTPLSSHPKSYKTPKLRAYSK